ncbi:unnamed protein product [Clonostachys solani]|uniref:25-hydroxycholesterol 7-alpha-hydroxylase n=1 Tax=Clonostachys solani TaxID=160281 RepID=A0A9N9W598_9HYPO|nr:unnamed protein product [Clonostachys solani]
MSSPTEASGSLPFQTNKFVITAAVIVLVGLLLNYLSSPSTDPREPPLVKPRIPVIGHLVGLIRYQNEYFTRLGKRASKGICSVPLFGSITYVMWDTNLIQSAFRNKDLSFVPFIVYVPREVDQGGVPEKVQDTNLRLEFAKAMTEGMARDRISQMNGTALKYITKELGAFGDEESVIDNAYVWVRNLMTVATTEALYGSANPLREQPSLVYDLWRFDEDLPTLLLGLFPSYTAPEGLEARHRLEHALGEYYHDKKDANSDVSAVTHQRADVIRKFVTTGTTIGVHELALLHVSTSNSIPTLFWFFAHIVTRPALVERVRDELMRMVGDNAGGTVTINLDVLTEECPLIVSCYREAIRISNGAVSSREVLADTTIQDGEGRSYLLKAGNSVRIPLDHLHKDTEAWGYDFAQFSSDRFLQADAAKAKLRRTSYAPFGGGKHLCPGRNFAFGENLGFMVSFILSFDVAPEDGNWETFVPPAMDKCTAADAVCKPAHNGAGFGIRIKRREGWESTTWKFTSGGVDLLNL